jgi:hypothetical protein
MPREAAPHGPLSRRGAILTAPMKIRKKGGNIILSQKTRLWFRAAVSVWATVVLMTPFMIYSELFSSQTTRFTCERGSGVCAVDGRPKDVPRLADITRAEMDHDFNRRDGTNWGINLVTRDGKKHSIEQQRAIKDSVIADYRSTVKAINAYLADGTQQKLDTSFTYRASLWEKLQSIFYLFFGVATLFVGWLLWTRRVYTFEAGKVTVVVCRPFQRATQEIGADRITAIADRHVFDRRRVELKLAGALPIPVVEAGSTETLVADPLAKELAEFLGKPLESVST